MNNNSLQGDLQEAIRNALNCANSFEGDLYALCNLYGVADGAVSGRLIPVAQKHSPTIGTASGALNYLLQNPTVLPSLGLNFVDGTDRLDSRVTFTRASNAWRFNSAGVLTQATTNTPRFDYDPATLAPRGLLIEEQRTNLLTYSADFDNAAWTKTRSTIAANSAVAPDGATTADKIVEDSTASNTHFFSVATLVTAGLAYTHSIYVKAAERSWIAMQGFDGATNPTAYFNLSTGVTGTATGCTATIQNAGNGWFRCSITYTVSTGTASAYSVYLATGNSSPIYTGNGTSGVYAWGAQLEAGAFATSYIPTTTAAATRAADVAVMTGTNFSSWYNATANTLFAEGSTMTTTATNKHLASISDSSFNNFVAVRDNAGGVFQGVVVSGGVTQANITTGTVVANATQKLALGFAANSFSFSANGTSGTPSSSGSLPVVDRMTIGNLAGTTQYLNGWIRRLAVYPRVLSASEQNSITA